MKIARQELPGKSKEEEQSRQGRLIGWLFNRPCRDSAFVKCITRQFLPGYFQPRLTALIHRRFDVAASKLTMGWTLSEISLSRAEAETIEAFFNL